MKLMFMLAALACAATTVSAHDFWIEPSTYRPDVGDVLELDLRVGEFFVGDELPRRSDRIVAFVLGGPTEVLDVSGEPGAIPAGRVIVHEAGGLLAGYRSHRSFIELPAEKFEQYLLEEGLEHVVEARARAGASTLPGREAYSRCAKSLVVTKEAGESLHSASLGFTLELMAQTDPTKHESGDEMSFLVHLDGKPLAGVLVVGTPAGDVEVCERARTDASGMASLRLDRRGPWIVRCVAMRPAPAGVAADWESLWASLTFQVGD